MNDGAQTDAPIRAAQIVVNRYRNEKLPYWRHKLADKLVDGALAALMTVLDSTERALEGSGEANREMVAMFKLMRRQRDECMRDLYGTTDDWSTEQMKFLQERFDEEEQQTRHIKGLSPYQGPEEHWPERPWKS